MWQSQDEDNRALAEIRKKGEKASQVVPATSSVFTDNGVTRHLHTAMVTGLTPGTSYEYRVGSAATSNSTTSSENDIQTLPLGIFTLPLSLIVIIARFIPTILQIFHKLYSQTLIYRVRVWCLLPLRKSALW